MAHSSVASVEASVVVGISRALNEADLVEYSIRRMQAQVDHIIIGAGPSDDGTTEILEGMDGITVLEDNALSWRQREVMSEYAQMAAGMGAEWVLPFDVDETFLPTGGGRIAERFAELPPEILIVIANNITHCATTEDDPSESDPMARMGWRSVEALPLGKVACRLAPDLRIEHGNHSARYGSSRYPPCVTDVIEGRHFPYRTPEQFIKRVQGAWPPLRDSGLPETHGAHMWGYGRVLDERGPDGLRELFNDHMLFVNPRANPEVVRDPLPALQLA